MGMVRLLVLQNSIAQVLPDICGRKECASLFQNFGGLKDGCRELRNFLLNFQYIGLRLPPITLPLYLYLPSFCFIPSCEYLYLLVLNRIAL